MSINCSTSTWKSMFSRQLYNQLEYIVEPCNIAVYLRSKKLYFHSISRVLCNKYIYPPMSHIYCIFINIYGTWMNICVQSALHTWRLGKINQSFLSALYIFYINTNIKVCIGIHIFPRRFYAPGEEHIIPGIPLGDSTCF